MKNSVFEVLKAASQRLSIAHIDNPRLDAEILLAHVLNCRRLTLYIDSDKKLQLETVFRFNQLINQRLKGVPVAYLINSKDFMVL